MPGALGGPFSVVLTTPVDESPFGVEAVTGKGFILYDDAFNDAGAVVTASSEVPGAGIANALDYLGYDFWQAASGDPQTVALTLDDAREIDYFGVAYHNLFSAQASIDWQYSDDGLTWTSANGGGFVPLSDKPFAMIFDKAAHQYWQLVIVPGIDLAPIIGVMMAGVSMRLQRGVRVGHRPAPYSRDVTLTTNMSELGRFIGRSRVSVSNTTELSLSKLSDLWLREKWVPFQIHAETKPFFFFWNAVRYPTEVLFGWTDDSTPRPENEHPTFMQVTMAMRGNA